MMDANANQLFVRQELRKVQAAANAATLRLRRAQTIRDVLAVSHVPLHPTIRFMARQIHELKALKVAAEKRARELVEGQLAEVKGLPPEERQRWLGQLRAREWMLLRGNFPSLASFTEMESRKLLSQARRSSTEEEPSGNDTGALGDWGG